MVKQNGMGNIWYIIHEPQRLDEYWDRMDISIAYHQLHVIIKLCKCIKVMFEKNICYVDLDRLMLSSLFLAMKGFIMFLEYHKFLN